MQLVRKATRLAATAALAAAPLTAGAAPAPESLAAIDCDAIAAESTCEVTIAPGLGLLAPRRAVVVHEDGSGFDLVGDLAIPTGGAPIALMESSLVVRLRPWDGAVESLVGEVRMPMPNDGFLGPVEVTERPLASMGFADGATLLGLEGPVSEAPLAGDRRYFFFNAVARFAAELPPISMQTPGGAGTVVLDPTDPFFYVAGEVQGFGGDGQESDAADADANADGSAGSAPDGTADGGAEVTADGDAAADASSDGSADAASPDGGASATDDGADEEDGDDAAGMAGFAFSLEGRIPFEPVQVNGVEDRMPTFDGHFFLRTSQPLTPLPISATGEFVYDLDPAEDGDTPFTPEAFAVSPDLAYGVNGALDVAIPFLRFFEFGFPLGDATAAIEVDGADTSAAFSGLVTADEFLPNLPIPVRPTGGIEVHGVLEANDPAAGYIHAEGSMGIDARVLGLIAGVPLGELYSQDAVLDVTVAGLSIQGSTSAGIHPDVQLAGEAGFEAFVSPWGQSRLAIFGNFVIAGEVLENAEMVVDFTGVRVNGRYLTSGYAFAMEGELRADGYLLQGSAELADPIETNAQASLAALNDVLAHREVVTALEVSVDASRFGVDTTLAAIAPLKNAVDAAQTEVNRIQSSIDYHSGRGSYYYGLYKKWKKKSCKWYDAACKSKRAYYMSRYYGSYSYHVGVRSTLYASRAVANASLAAARAPLTAAETNLSNARSALALAEAELATGIAALREAEAVLASYPPIDGSLRMIATIGIEDGEVYASVEGDWNGQPLTEGYVNLGDPGEACLVVPQVGPVCSSL